MTDGRPSLDRDYFETLYASSIDPWGFRTSAYEQRKYADTLDILTRPRYERGLEVGCSIGVFTRLLSGRCDTLLAVDTSDRALAEAKRDCADLERVRFEPATLPRDFPPGTFDLVVLSEVLYYLSNADLADMATRCSHALEPGGDIVLCHWLGETNYPLSGDEAADRFITAMTPRLRVSASRRDPEYRLDRLSAPS